MPTETSRPVTVAITFPTAPFGCYLAALRVYTEADFPKNWAGTQDNLGTAATVTCQQVTGARTFAAVLGCYQAGHAGSDGNGIPLGLGDDAIKSRTCFEKTE